MTLLDINALNVQLHTLTNISTGVIFLCTMIWNVNRTWVNYTPSLWNGYEPMTVFGYASNESLFNVMAVACFFWRWTIFPSDKTCVPFFFYLMLIAIVYGREIYKITVFVGKLFAIYIIWLVHITKFVGLFLLDSTSIVFLVSFILFGICGGYSFAYVSNLLFLDFSLFFTKKKLPKQEIIIWLTLFF
jgi:hypothetical protein